MGRILRSLACGGAVLLVSAAPASALTWSPETVDGAGGGGGRIDAQIGRFSSAVQFQSQLNLFYYDATGGNLRRAVQTASGWTFSTLDGAGGANGRVNGDVGRESTAMLIGTELHLFYYATSGGDLRHAWLAGGAWHFQTLDGAGGPNGRISGNVGLWSTAAQIGGVTHLLYADSGGANLRHAWLAAGTWHFETVDGAGGGGGRLNGLVAQNTAAIVYGGRLHVFYYWQHSVTAGGDTGPVCDIRHATLSSGSWSFSRLFDSGVMGDVCQQAQSLAAVRVTDTSVFVIHHEVDTFGCVEAEILNGSTWTTTYVDCGDPDVGQFEPSYASAVLFGGSVRTIYHSYPYGPRLKAARWNGSDWQAGGITTLDGSPWTSLVQGGAIRTVLGNAGASSDLVLLNGS